MTKFNNNICLLAGNLGAGKSTAAKYIATRFGYQHLSFVEEIWKPILMERGLLHTRENLQQLGIELMRDVGPAGLVQMLLEKGEDGSTLVIDDVRRSDVVDIFKDFVEAVFLIFIRADFETRYPRLVVRDGISSPEEQHKAEAIETEVTIPDLEQLADYVVSNTGELSEFYESLDSAISESEARFMKVP